MNIELWFFGLGWIVGFFCMGCGILFLKWLSLKKININKEVREVLEK